MIGKKYDLQNYNCADFVLEYYRNLGKKIPSDMKTTSINFAKFLHKNFTEVDRPFHQLENGILVIGDSKTGKHVGVVHNRKIRHNLNFDEIGKGQVVDSTITFFESRFANVRFGQWSQ